MNKNRFSAGAVAAWHSCLPHDFQQVIEHGREDDPWDLTKQLDDFETEILGVSAFEMPGIVPRYVEMFKGMTPAQRIRFVAWVASQTWPNPDVLKELVDEDEGTGGGKRGELGTLFAKDILSFADVVAARLTQAAASRENVSISNLALEAVKSAPELGGQQ